MSENYYDADGNPVNPEDVTFNIAELAPNPLTEDVTINLPVSGEIEEDSIKATTTGREGAPMPRGTENGSSTSFINSDGSIILNDITYTQPGDYAYDVKLDSGIYDIDTDEFTVVVKVVLDESTNTLSIAEIVAVDGEGNEMPLESLKLGIRKHDSANPDTRAANNAYLFVVAGAMMAGFGSTLHFSRRRI